MDIISFGKIVVAVAGTPVQLTTDATIRVHRVVVSQVPAVAGVMYFGINNAKNTFNKGTGAGVLKAFLPAGASGYLDSHEIDCRDDDGNLMLAKDFVIDAASNNDSLFAYGVVA